MVQKSQFINDFVCEPFYENGVIKLDGNLVVIESDRFEALKLDLTDPLYVKLCKEKSPIALMEFYLDSTRGPCILFNENTNLSRALGYYSGEDSFFVKTFLGHDNTSLLEFQVLKSLYGMGVNVPRPYGLISVVSTERSVSDKNISGDAIVMEKISNPLYVTMYSKISPKQNIDYLINTANEFQKIHNSGILHGDIKPNNLFLYFLMGEPTPLIFDFNMARHIGDKYPCWFGTPTYCDPIMVDNGTIDIMPTIDIYSLGNVAYESFVGRTPGFVGKHMSNTQIIRNKKQLCLKTIKEDLGDNKAPPPISNVILKMLEPNSENRFQSMADVASALTEAKEEHYKHPFRNFFHSLKFW